jgi:glucokinase
VTTIGLDVGGTFLKAVVMNEAGVVSNETERLPANGVLDHVARVAQRMAGEVGAKAVGVGLAGLVQWPEGSFVWGPHMVDGDTPFKERLQTEIELPVLVDNDANLAAFAEASAGAARGAGSVLMLAFGTGIGAGLIVNGSIYRGRSFAGEVGHMTMVPDGSLCACGRRGCWETVISGEVLDRTADDLLRHAPHGLVGRMADSGRADASHLTRAADLGDPAAQAVLAEAGTWLGRGAANLIMVLDPEVVVVGGAVVEAGEWLLDPARQAIASHVSGSAHRAPTPVVEAEFGRLAGAVGAAFAARDLVRGDSGTARRENAATTAEGRRQRKDDERFNPTR